MSVTDSLTNEFDPRVAELRVKFDHFYATTTTYTDFQGGSHIKPRYWTPILPVIQEILAARGPDSTCNVLEFGSGRTGFKKFLGELAPRVRFTAQDVTPQNKDYLADNADRVHIGDLRDLHDRFDVIFSTFVWEHVSHPQSTMKHLLDILNPGGSMFIACPRYDMPGYIPPSARHYNAIGRARVSAWLLARRIRRALGQRGPAFTIHTDPAVLRGPWFRDSDAIHWVALSDFADALPPGYTVERIRLPSENLKTWIWTRFLLAFIRIRRAPHAS